MNLFGVISLCYVACGLIFLRWHLRVWAIFEFGLAVFFFIEFLASLILLPGDEDNDRTKD